jgi:uncharacterized membrane protein YkvA (DUF1232 family)
VVGLDVALIAAGAALAIYSAFVVALVLLGRREDVRALARVVPDCAVLFARLLRDPDVSRARKLVLVGLVAYLALPFDLVPDFIPVAGQLDDAILVVLALRALVRGGGGERVVLLWPGRRSSLDALLRLAGCTRDAIEDSNAGEGFQGTP